MADVRLTRNLKWLNKALTPSVRSRQAKSVRQRVWAANAFKPVDTSAKPKMVQPFRKRARKYYQA